MQKPKKAIAELEADFIIVYTDKYVQVIFGYIKELNQS